MLGASIRILHENLLLTGLAVACLAPNLTGTEVNWPISGCEIGEGRANFLKVNLEHSALPKRRLHRPCFKSAVTLAEHDLLPFGMLQIDEFFFFTTVSNVKADDVLPENQAGVEIRDMKLRDDFRPPVFGGAFRPTLMSMTPNLLEKSIGAAPIDAACQAARSQPHQAHSAAPMTRSRSWPFSHGNSSVNIVTH
jgi:hypothetical protein